MTDIGFWGKVSTAGDPPPPGSLAFKAWRALTKFHMALFRATKGRIGGRMDRMPICILHHRGAKSGRERETPLSYLPDGDRVVLIASYGGAPKSPAWYFNLKAHPEIEIERRGKREPMRAHRATPEERTELWPRILEMNPGYGVYQKRTEREIPVIICAPRSP